MGAGEGIEEASGEEADSIHSEGSAVTIFGGDAHADEVCSLIGGEETTLGSHEGRDSLQCADVLRDYRGLLTGAAFAGVCAIGMIACILLSISACAAQGPGLTANNATNNATHLLATKKETSAKCNEFYAAVYALTGMFVLSMVIGSVFSINRVRGVDTISLCIGDEHQEPDEYHDNHAVDTSLIADTSNDIGSWAMGLDLGVDHNGDGAIAIPGALAEGSGDVSTKIVECDAVVGAFEFHADSHGNRKRIDGQVSVAHV